MNVCQGLDSLTRAQPEPLQNLSNLVKAQLIYFSTAAETLSVSYSMPWFIASGHS